MPKGSTKVPNLSPPAPPHSPVTTTACAPNPLPPTPSTATSPTDARAVQKGKGQEELQAFEDDDAFNPEEGPFDLVNKDAGAVNVPPLKVHRYAPFTLERRKKVTEMVQGFFKALNDYAKHENIDPTAVTKCFSAHLSSLKLSPWAAIQHLQSIVRNSGSGYSSNKLHFPTVHLMQCNSEVDFDGLFNTAVTGRPVTLEDDNAASIEGYDEDESDNETPQPSTSTSAPKSTAAIDKIKYQELLVKARRYVGGEKRLKHAKERMEEFMHTSATDNWRVQEIKTSNAELTYGITVTGLITGSSALHTKSLQDLVVFGPNEEVINMMNLIVKGQDNIHSFIRTSI